MNELPKLFDDKERPVLDQIIELAEFLEHDEKTVKRIKEEFQKGNIDFVVNFAQTLAVQFVGKTIFDAINEVSSN